MLETVARHWEDVLLTIGEQPSIGGHHRAAKLKHQSAVEIQPNRKLVERSTTGCCESMLIIRTLPSAAVSAARTESR